MSKPESEKKQARAMKVVERVSDLEFEELVDEDAGLGFRRKRRKLPKSQRSPSMRSIRKRSIVKPSDKWETVIEPLHEALVSILGRLNEAPFTKLRAPSQRRYLRKTLEQFSQQLLTKEKTLLLAKAKIFPKLSDQKGTSSYRRARNNENVECQNGSNSNELLEAALRSLAPKRSPRSSQTEALQSKIAKLKKEEDHWRKVTNPSFMSLIQLNKSARSNQHHTFVLDPEQIDKDRKRLFIQSLELRQSISFAEEVTKKGEKLCKDLLEAHNRRQMTNLMVSYDPKVVFKNLLFSPKDS